MIQFDDSGMSVNILGSGGSGCPCIPFDPSRHMSIFEGCRKIAILDLDGCLFDDEWRIHLIDKEMKLCDEKFDAYHRALVDDSIIIGMHEEVEKLALLGYGFIILTARPSQYLTDTVGKIYTIARHMTKHCPALLIMRNTGCIVPSPEYKFNAVQSLMSVCSGKLKNSLLHVNPSDITMYDDRIDILSKCSKLGIKLVHATKHGIADFYPLDIAEGELPRNIFAELEKEMTPEQENLPTMLITGSNSGLGKCLVEQFKEHFNVIEYDIVDDNDVAVPAIWLKTLPRVDFLINCAGVNLNVWFDELSLVEHQRIMDVNANSIVYMTQAVLPQLIKSNGAVINIVSNAANMPMTSSLSYNMSKAAALMATKQMAHELTPKYGITVFSISPNKLAGTKMSKYIENRVCEVRGWTPEFAAEYQRKALMHNQETDPAAVARMIAHLIGSGDYIYMSGCDLMFGK